MKYKFPLIENIEQVLFAVDPQYFMVADRGDHKIVNYIYSSPETFPDIISEDDHVNIMRREFRGLIFDSKTGDIIRRPYPKFFNVGEKHETSISVLDVSQEHKILDKLDGSMICPYVVGDKEIWGTKMGFTDFSHDVADFVGRNVKYRDFSLDCINNGYTPIYEWMSPRNRVVIDYGPKERLVLTAVRNMRTGEFWSDSKMRCLSPVEVVGNVPGETLTQDFINKVRGVEGLEGFVIRFNSGHMIKIKADHYCQLHRVKSDIQYERGVVELILNEKIDDLKPLLPENDLERLEEYETALNSGISDSVNKILQLAYKLESDQISRKDFALNIAPSYQPYVNVVMFKLFGSNCPSPDLVRNMVKELILKNTIRNNKFEEFRKCDIFDSVPRWQTIMMDDE